MGVDLDHRQVHQRRQPHRALHVVEEVEERGPERAQAVAVEAVHDRPHAVLAHAVVHVAPGVVVARDRAAVVDQRERGRLEVGRAAHQVRDLRRRPLDHLLGGLAGGDGVVRRVEPRRIGVPALRQPAVHHQRQLGPQLGMLRLVRVGARVPLGLGLRARGHGGLAEMLGHLVGHEEVGVGVPAVGLLGEPHLVLAQRRAVGRVGVLLVGRALADVGANDDQRRLAGALGVRDRLGEALLREVLAQVLHVPAVGLEALAHVLAERHLGLARELDLVVVVEADQPAEPEVTGQRARLGGHALLHVAVAGDRVGVMVDQLVAVAVEARGEHALRQREADRVGDALAERPGRDLHARGALRLELGMAGGRAAELAEVLEVLERDPVAREVEDRVEEHRRVARRQHEAVAVEPLRVRRVVLHLVRVEAVGHGRQRHRSAGVAGVRLLHPVHREGADGVDRQVFRAHLTPS